MARRPDREAIYDAAQRWKEECLANDGSVFGAGSVWTTANLDQLDRYFIQQPNPSSEKFEQKLKKQLAEASPAAKQLAAEMLWVMMLVPTNVGAPRKRELVRELWSWSGAQLSPDEPMLLQPMEHGIANPGAGLSSNRATEFEFFIRVVQAFKRLDTASQSALLGDAWRTSEWMSGIQGKSRPQMRHILLHLLFPDDVDAIVTGGDKRSIVAEFSSELASHPGKHAWSSDPLTADEQKMQAIRKVFESRPHDGFVNFYASPLRERWRGEDPTPADPAPSAAPPTRQRVWVINAGERGARWPAFYAGGHVAISLEQLGDLHAYRDVEQMQRRIKRLYRPKREPIMGALACWQFAREIAIGDAIFVKQGGDRILGYGTVTSDYRFDASLPDFNHLRSVQWLRQGDWALPDDARVPTKMLTEVTHYTRLTDFLRTQIVESEPPAAEVRYSVDRALDGVFMPRDEFERILASLRRRKNVILQGSPGVGKSFLARRLAYTLIGYERRDDVQMVQFHQSYAYEDFVQGWRPNEKGGFELRDGVFHEFCRRAEKHPGRQFVFIIDEINRGNLSKILGELMLLIEADKRGPQFAIPLTYAKSALDTFSVPENVHIIGLMNTADRSLAMVDYALRRRFAFFTLAPGFAEPAFRAMLSAKGVDDAVIDLIVDRVRRVNEKITSDRKNLGPGFEVGHSYFCPTERVTDAVAWYDAVINEEIQPLLHEYWFDDRTHVEQCLKMLRR